jgi:hypothetical protein
MKEFIKNLFIGLCFIILALGGLFGLIYVVFTYEIAAEIFVGLIMVGAITSLAVDLGKDLRDDFSRKREDKRG